MFLKHLFVNVLNFVLIVRMKKQWMFPEKRLESQGHSVATVFVMCLITLFNRPTCGVRQFQDWCVFI